MDPALALTGLALAVCLVRSAWKKRDPTLPVMLLAMWSTALALDAAGARMATFVFSAAVLNLAVGATALAVIIHRPARFDARVTGGLSMAIMPAHWIMSASNGTADWTIYAWSCNLVYITQCLVAGGWLDGLGRGIAGFFARLRPVRRLRNGGG